ncbi:MAG TPA: DUF3280 domain-containing protein [Rhodopila sp.]|nr:DUF3280 domain-containing protein [Rhodopila sp.]
MRTLSCLLLACSCLAPIRVWAGSSVPTAVFNFDLHDTSLQGEEQGPKPAEQGRLHALDEQLRSLLAKSGCCTILPLGKVAEKTASIDMSNCNGCDADFAREIGARLAVTGSVQKVSNLILNINLSVRDVASGQVVHAGSVDIRGNTDESWSRGLSYLLRDRLHPNQW